ncbi:uncharacterized protein BO88DRAFT_486923 [Aspergillus vadensis CBS 113365]|uniref:EthD domain-containing protein n=1 Tax=Aspergillus vadensis (strain CBS 113365 / IMI 142717 / IBT 24658) TaxID=1448311 RepID=A0A319BY80_ASPVC|nr:hypothetical protein BO88DRAFT_486923 [Aspergillus vadensis CBS 113365]PYH70853.1 hypothetical protein BO88DRAFT_486923 [Aspergillus vadensis CBS 113365]
MSSPQLWLYASSRLRDPTVTDENFSQWYQEHHVPDVLKTGSVTKGEFFRRLGPQKQFRWLAAYDCDDLDFMEPENFARIPKTHSMLGTTKSCLEIAEFDTRIFQQLFVLKNGEGNEAGNSGPDRYLLTCTFHCDDNDYEALERRCIDGDIIHAFPGSRWLKISRPFEDEDTYLGFMIVQALGDVEPKDLLWLEDNWRSYLAETLGLERQFLQPHLWELLRRCENGS